MTSASRSSNPAGCATPRSARSFIEESGEAMSALSAPCSLLIKLFDGQHGLVHLARLTKGEDAGRVVLLRELETLHEPEFAADIDLARSIAHPSLLKLLGVIRDRDRLYLASEYVPGVALTELRSALRKLHTTITVPNAVCIALAALRASLTLRDLLRNATGIDAVSAFHPDSIWIAEYGETLLCPVPARPTAGRTPYSSSAANSAPGVIMELTTGLSPAKLLGQGLEGHLPAPLATALKHALSQHAAGKDGEAVLAEALANLPANLMGTEDQVAEELTRVVGPRLYSRRLLVAVEHRDDEPGADEATVITRLAKPERPFDADEPTRSIRLPRPVVAQDVDGPTQVLSSRPAQPITVRPPAKESVPPVAVHAVLNVSAAPATMLASTPPPSAPPSSIRLHAPPSIPVPASAPAPFNQLHAPAPLSELRTANAASAPTMRRSRAALYVLSLVVLLLLALAVFAFRA